MVEIKQTSSKVALKDLMGFNGRCDAIIFSADPNFVPPKQEGVLDEWRRKLTGKSLAVVEEGKFDLVVVGGGYGGLGAAIGAARMGAKVALIQNRMVLGGNGSAEVRVWAMGNTPGGLYPIGDIIQELEDSAKASPGTYEEFEDAKKERIVRAEKNVSLYLGHHGFRVEMDGSRIKAVHALDVKGGIHRRFEGTFVADATGHGFIAGLAGADGTMQEKGRMGMSNMWAWRAGTVASSFPKTPWALDLNEGEFPYPNRYHAQWFWESGFDKHPIKDLEAIRDWNLRANFGAWNAMKNRGAYARSDKSGKEHANAELTWMAYVGGTRETQQFFGDVILTEEDIVESRLWPDASVLTTWSIDLHYPKEQYAKKFPDNPFISIAKHGKGVDRKKGYPIPYRCFYSRNVDNLFLAGRMMSVTHEALGTVRVMKTLGMVGVVCGKAAAIGAKHQCTPREVYAKHLPELIESMRLPGKARRTSLGASADMEPIPMPKWIPSPPGKEKISGIKLNTLQGIVVDDRNAKLTGKWTEGQGLPGFIEAGYRYNSGDGGAVFMPMVKQAGRYEVRIAYRSHENRSGQVAIDVKSKSGTTRAVIDQRKAPTLDNGFSSIGTFEFETGPAIVTISNAGGSGNLVIDAIQLLSVK